MFNSAPDPSLNACWIRRSGSCGPLHGEHWWPCGRSWCSCGSGSHELPCADASWAEKFSSWCISSVKTRPRLWGLFWSQNGDRLAIQQYIAHYGLLSSIFFAFLQTFLKNLCGETFNFFTHFPWKTFYPQYLVAFLRIGHKAISQTQVCLFYVL